MKLTAHEIKNMIKNKEVSVEEIIRSYLNRIDKFDTTLGAYLYVEKEGAFKRAKNLDKKIKHGEKMGRK